MGVYSSSDETVIGEGFRRGGGACDRTAAVFDVLGAAGSRASWGLATLGSCARNISEGNVNSIVLCVL